MAEVLSPPLQSSTISLLHSRPSSADAFSGSQQQYAQPQRLGQAPRSMYHGQNSYRGATTPVQPYAFQSTPTLRQDMRTTSAPTTSHGPIGSHRTTASTSTSSSDASSQPPSKDDSVIGARPGSFINLSSSIPDLSLSLDQPVKASPDRYRRPGQKRADSTASGPRAASPQLGTPAAVAAATANVAQQPQPVQRQSSVDDMALSKSGQSDLAKSRYRRRSLNQLETQNLTTPPAQAGPGAQRPSSGHGPSATSTPTTIRPVSLHPQEGEAATDVNRKGSAEPIKAAAVPRTEQKLSVPARGSSDANKRLGAPSPLSRQASDVDSQAPSVTASPTKPRTYAAVAQAAVHSPSPAAAQLAAVSDRDLNKGMKSRLRRAFSFGSAQELRRAAGENNQAQSHQVQNRQAQQMKQQHQQQIDDEMDAEQLEIARRQEAAGIGAGIYSGQGGFSGSTDNLSISSTASSASMMLRKMGRGAKKSARSVKSLFRPKSVIGVPAADGPLETTVGPTVAQVSMVTVEAERQNVNVNAHPGELADGGTGFPKLERNSMDAASVAAVVEKQRGSADGSDSRRSVVGSDKDRAEVLAAVKKGILKRSGTGSPSGSPVVKPTDANLTPVPHITESPSSSMPSTPREAPQGRSASTPNVNGDYFAKRVTVTHSMPSTPNGSVRSISFSPRIQFHDVWSSTEYDRRGEVATCNRLTPMLAQQIKEELNTFKMEMEVHEMSKPHTHFF